MKDMLEHHAALFHISMKIVFLSGGCVLVVLHFWSSSSGTVFSVGAKAPENLISLLRARFDFFTSLILSLF